MTTTNDYTQFIPEVWSKKITADLNKSGVMMQCVNNDYEGEIKAAGDIVHIRSFGSVSVADYAGSSITYNTLNSTDETMAIDQKKMFAFKVPDISSAQADIDVINGYIERAKIAIDLEKDTYLLGKHADTDAGNVVGTDAAPIILTASNVYGQLVEVAKGLKKSNALSGGKSPWLVINPDIEALLLQSSAFTQASQLGDKTVREGSIGRIAGMDVLVCTNLESTTDTINTVSCDVHQIMAGTNDAITFASQVVNIEKLRDPDTFSTLVRGLYVYGAKTVQPKALAKLTCTTTDYS